MRNISLTQLIGLNNRPWLTQPQPLKPVFRIPFLFDYYSVDMKPVSANLFPGLPNTDLWGYVNYDGTVSVPPVIKARRNQPVLVRWNNKLAATNTAVNHPFINENQIPPMPMNMGPVCGNVHTQIGDAVVHFHGGEVMPGSDARPTRPIKPGKAVFDWYPNRQRGATLWVHDHTMDYTATNVYAGLSGFYILEDTQEEAALHLPSGNYDWPIVLQDRILDSSGKFVYRIGGIDPATNIRVPEFIGDLPLVNGQLLPRMQVEPTWYRLRLLNGSNTRFYNLRFHITDLLDASQYGMHPDIDVWQIATDGGLTSRPAQYESNGLLLAPGERVELVVNFARVGNSKITLYSDIAIPYQGAPNSSADYFPLLGFEVGNSILQAQHFSPDTNLRHIPDLPAPSTTPKIVTLLEKVEPIPGDVPGISTPQASMAPHGSFEADGVTPKSMHYCEGITVGETVVLNATEDWTFSNTTGDFHPMHMHLMQFQVVSGGQNLMDCNGVPVKAMKDTVAVPPGGTVTVRAKFSPYKGEYVYHCHILEHEDMGMMRTFKVI